MSVWSVRFNGRYFVWTHTGPQVTKPDRSFVVVAYGSPAGAGGGDHVMD
jgi:hypothetical protein